MQCSGSIYFGVDPDQRIRASDVVDPDPDPDPAIFIIDLQDASKKQIFYTNFFCLLLFEGIFTLFFKENFYL